MDYLLQILIIRINSRKLKHRNTQGVRYQTVSKKHNFKFLLEEKINELKKIKLKRRSEAKVK